MSTSRTLEPAVKLLFEIVNQNPTKDAKNSEQMLVQVKVLIQAIQQLEASIKIVYEGLSKTLNKEIKPESGISLNASDEDGATFLTAASKKGHTSIVGLLLEHKANPDLPNAKTGETPLCLACEHGYKEIVHDLLEHKANPDLQDEKAGATPLLFASQKGYKEIAHDLLGHKANPNLPNAKTGETHSH